MGLRSIDFAKLPPAEVESRLGGLGRQFHDGARSDPRPLSRAAGAVVFQGWTSVAARGAEPFLFVGGAAWSRLTRRSTGGAAMPAAGADLEARPRQLRRARDRLPAPTRDVKTLVTLVRLELEARPPGAPVVGFAFAAHPDKPRRAQLTLFGPPALSPDRLATTIARLAALLGADRVGSPRTVDGHRPERFASSGYEPPPPPDSARAPRAGRGLLGARPATARRTRGDPRKGTRGAAAASALRQIARGASPEIAGAVRIAAGPWSMEEDGGRRSAARDYWDVELSSGLYRIYRDRASRPGRRQRV